MVNIYDGFAKATKGFFNALLLDDEAARKIGERCMAMYTGMNKRDLR